MESAKAILDDDEVHDVVDAVKVDPREDHIDSISGDKHHSEKHQAKCMGHESIITGFSGPQNEKMEATEIAKMAATGPRMSGSINAMKTDTVPRVENGSSLTSQSLSDCRSIACSCRLLLFTQYKY